MTPWGKLAWNVLAAGLLPIPVLAQAPNDSRPIPTFGTTVVVPFGLRGDIYLLRSGADRLPDFGKLEPIGAIYTRTLDVQPRNAFTIGYPGVEKRYEWFAIDYNGRFWIQTPGSYRFRLTSDDGSKLYIDDHVVIDNDGLHPPEGVSGRITLRGGIHTIRASYFQGPCLNRTHPCVALMLDVRPPGEKWRTFSTDEFKPPPNPKDWKYGDPSQLTVTPDPNIGRRKLGKPVRK